ncbi:MAG: metalloregulator ArsR/SmtB family transcription factor [Burkholderiales bacterium]
MVKYSEAALDAVFAALSDSTRRKVLASLSEGSVPVSELAQPHGMSLPGFMKHLRVLEDAGLIGRTKEGRVVSCTLSAGPMKEAASWMARYEKFWTERLDALGRYLYHQEELQSWNKPSSRKSPPSASPGAPTRRRKKSGAPGRTRKH